MRATRRGVVRERYDDLCRDGRRKSVIWCNMFRSSPIVLITLLACCLAGARTTAARIPFRATVQDVVLLSQFSGKVIPVGVDPRYALTLRIEAIDEGSADFAAGEVITFAIHSPTLLFASDEPKGKSYRFVVDCQSSEDGKQYSGLEVQRKR